MLTSDGRGPGSPRLLLKAAVRHTVFFVAFGAVLVAGAIRASAQGPSSSPVELSEATPAAESASPAANTASPQQQAPVGTTRLPNIDINPMPATSGTIGLFTVETGEMLESGWSFSIYGNRFGRMPGSVVVSNYGINVGWAYRKWVNLYTVFQPEVATQVGNPSQLSLDTPPNIMQFPQYQNSIYRNLGPGQNPAYVEDFPFVSRNDSGPGDVTIGAKFGLLSERNGAPLSLSIRNDAIIPTRYTVNVLLGNGTQTGAFADMVMVATSRNFLNLVLVAANFGYEFTSNPRSGGASEVTLADQIHLGSGFILFPAKRLQFMSEYNGLVFAGAATPNTTFGARDPVDGVWGARFYILPQLAIDAGYRYMLNLSNLHDRSGFVINLGIVSWPF
jgi:hypothetical protein